MRRPFDPLPVWAQATLTGADPEPVNDPPAGEPPTVEPDPDADAVAGRKALALVKRQSVHNAIAAHRGKGGNSHEWQDAEVVSALLDHDKIDVDLDSGAVSGLDDQLDALAKAKPFLLKQEQPQSVSTSVGTPPNGGNTGHHEHQMTAESLAREHPGVYGDMLGRLAGITSN